jgi:plastocyanin
MRIACPLIVLAAAGLGLAQGDAQRGAIAGLVRFNGTVPPTQKIITSDGAVLMHNDLVVDPKSKGLRWVAAYLQDAKPQTPVKKPKMVAIDQKDMVFMPRVVGVQDGQTVRFDNNDLSNHAVQATSSQSENTFNVLTPMGQPFDFEFKAQKAPVQIGCPIHAWMRAWIYVMPHPWVAVSDAQGRFQLDDVPPGTYKLRLAHPDTTLRETVAVRVEAGKTARIEVNWDKVK